MLEMSKSAFAAHVNLSPGRISQMIKSGIIGADALTEAGQVIVETATAQIRERRHPGQSLGNGLLTAPKAPSVDEPPSGDVASQIQLEKLDEVRRKNRREQREEALAEGRLVVADELQRQIGRSAQQLVSTFMGMAPDIANAIAAKFELPQRDVLHLVRQVMNDKRAAAASALGKNAGEMPETTEAILN